MTIANKFNINNMPDEHLILTPQGKVSKIKETPITYYNALMHKLYLQCIQFTF